MVAENSMAGSGGVVFGGGGVRAFEHWMYNEMVE